MLGNEGDDSAGKICLAKLRFSNRDDVTSGRTDRKQDLSLRVQVFSAVKSAGLGDDESRVVATCDVGDSLTQSGLLRPVGSRVAMQPEGLDNRDADLIRLLQAGLCTQVWPQSGQLRRTQVPERSAERLPPLRPTAVGGRLTLLGQPLCRFPGERQLHYYLASFPSWYAANTGTRVRHARFDPARVKRRTLARVTIRSLFGETLAGELTQCYHVRRS